MSYGMTARFVYSDALIDMKCPSKNISSETPYMCMYTNLCGLI